MDVHVRDDQIGRYFRRIQLGLRFLAHGARARTTCQWSGLTPDQLVTLRRRWMFNSDERLRGPSPSSFEIFFRSALTSSQAALFVCICRIVGITNSRETLESGEKICEAFEIFREWEPDAQLEFEQAVLLMVGAADAEKIELVNCSRCRIALLYDKMGDSRKTCRRCTFPVARARTALPLVLPRSGARRRE
jgi:Flagellar transcriptional activator (FlhC)